MDEIVIHEIINICVHSKKKKTLLHERIEEEERGAEVCCYKWMKLLARSEEVLCVAVCCSMMQRAVVCCNVLQCVAVCCSVLQCVAVLLQYVVDKVALVRAVINV